MLFNDEINNELILFTKNASINIYVSENENSAVQIAAKNLIRDISWTCHCKATFSNEMNKCTIVIGTIDNKEIQDIIAKRGLSLEKLKKEDGSYHWEGFLQEVVDNVFYIIGTDRRGTIFGIYDLCEALGVSPWYYWADVPVKTRNEFRFPNHFVKVDWPSVKYRGIFLNDEEELHDWAKLHTADDTIGPETYESLYELLLRLKANYIWPAMHVNAFNENARNGQLAEEMGVVVGTSHCDMLLRSNQNEWSVWKENKGYTDAIYDYSIEGINRERLKEYWTESIITNQNYEVCYTMGMRGIHDSGFQTKTLDEDFTLTKQQRLEGKVAFLNEVIRDQKQMLIDVLGEEKGQQVLKTFVPYKEVLSLYNCGLELPEDLTLIWADDNYGNIRRYPNDKERKRSGGNGLYYHSSYWAPPGTGMSYLFINSTPLAHMGNELKKSYDSGIQKIWVLNVGGLKPVEQDMEYFLRYGWEVDKETGTTHNAFDFTTHWINSNFSGNHGSEVAELYETFAQVTNVRKIEHMTSNVFSQTVYGDEAGRRLMVLEDIFRRSNEILNHLPDEEQAAFFQLFLMKIHASYYTNHEYYYADRSVLAFERGNMQAADACVEYSRKMTAFKRNMIHFYNKKMSGGKWDAMLTPENYPPPAAAMYPVLKPALKIGEGGLRVHLWNEENKLLFYIYGQRQKWIELGNQGVGSIPFAIVIQEGADWISISEVKGSIHTEKRILVTVYEPKQQAGKKGLIVVHDHRDNKVISIPVEVEKVSPIPDHFVGYVEAEGYVSIPAAGFDKCLFNDAKAEGAESSGWVTVSGLGRYSGAGVMARRSELDTIEDKIEDSPYLEYGVYFTHGGEFLLEIQRLLTLDSTGQIRFGIGFDDAEPMIIESDITDEWLGQWQECIMDNGEKMIVELPYLSSGAHTLQLYMVDRYVTISKFIIYTNPRKETNLGPATSWHTDMPVVRHGIDISNTDWDALEQLGNDFYNTLEKEVQLPPVMYANNDSAIHSDFIPVDEGPKITIKLVPQTALGDKRYANLYDDSSRKDIVKAFGSGTFVENEGVVAIEAEYVLENSDDAFLTSSKDNRNLSWSHLQAETNGRTGFAMHVAEPEVLWEKPDDAPGMHYKININRSGVYYIWLLIRHYNGKSDSCYLSMDGEVIPLSKQLGRGELDRYETLQIYYWARMTDVKLTKGQHLFSILARKSELRVDRIYLTTGAELPPIDVEWKDSDRKK